MSLLNSVAFSPFLFILAAAKEQLCVPTEFFPPLSIEFIGMTPVNKIIRVSGAQFRSPSPVCPVLCSTESVTALCHWWLSLAL